MHIHKNDLVKVITGRDSGKKGKVLRVIPSAGRVQVEGINIVKRSFKARPGVRQAGIVSMPAMMDISKVQLVCPSCNKPMRVTYQINNGVKVRICRLCKATISQ